ncbi:hypothetical protein [Alsobacter sp. SYSU BS001988]
MAELFQTGAIANLVLLVLAAEALAVLWFPRRLVSPPSLRPFAVSVAANLAAGAFLALALRSALRGEEWPFVAVWLCAAFIAHAADMAARFGPALLGWSRARRGRSLSPRHLTPGLGGSDR